MSCCITGHELQFSFSFSFFLWHHIIPSECKGWCVNAPKKGFNYYERALICCQLFVSSVSSELPVSRGSRKIRTQVIFGREEG